MNIVKRLDTRILAGMSVVAVLLASVGPTRADDTDLFSTNVPPNVMLLVDNSGSMAHIVWHEDFDPSLIYSCNAGTGGWNPGNGSTQFWSSNVTVTACGTTRTYYVDPLLTGNTRFDENYLNWLHSLPDGDPRLAAIAASNNGTFSTCLGGGTFHKYKRSRTTALKHILREVICQVNAQTPVRFGIAQFRGVTSGDAVGGHVVTPSDDYTAAHATAIDTAITQLRPESWTPLAESLFQVYTYFMSRTVADIPFGQDGITKFPSYRYELSAAGTGGAVTASPPGSPVQYTCQKSFVIVITDGEPTMDDFDDTPPLSDGFPNFNALIGDYNTDNVNPEAGTELPGGGNEPGWYLDDVAKFMQENDFRPDLADTTGIQKLDVYAVGFTTSAPADAILQKTASVGGGLFFRSNDAETLANNIVSAITDIIEKSQSFTAATVPASRTVDGARIYVSFFIPSASPGAWEGHLKNFEFNVKGEILDASGNCVIDDPSTPVNAPPCDAAGTLRTNATGSWDAADNLPITPLRALVTSRLTTGAPGCGVGQGSECVAFSAPTLTAADLGVTFAEKANYAASAATNAEQLADEIVDYGRGCQFGTSPCVDRPSRLGDVFHSNPIVVATPNAPINEQSYIDFAIDHQKRTRMIYAGANDGFLHGVQAGAWNAGLVPPALDDGTGQELFGFMPYPARQNIKQLSIDSPPRDYYYVDGSAQAADVWLPTAPLQTAKAKTEWHTIVTGGLREGGRTYYALDVTNPPGNPDAPTGYRAFPTYMWEFPCEAASCNGWRQYMGETWSEPVVTRVRVAIDGDNNSGEGYERWVAIFGAGYDLAGDPNSQATYDATNGAGTSRAGRAVFMVDIATGRVLAVKRFEPTSTDLEEREMKYAFASTPAVFDLDFDGFADSIMIGDLGGNMWKWSVRNIGEFTAAPTDGPVPSGHNQSQANWKWKRFFTAPTYTSAVVPVGTFYKSFFFPPTGTLKEGKLYLAWGSGERDNLKFAGFPSSDVDNNRYYVVIDPDKYETLSPAPFPTAITEADLTDLDAISDCTVIAAAQGYFFRGEDGEKFISTSFIFLGDIWTGSFKPVITTDPCIAAGEAFIYRFSLTCGEGQFTVPPTEDPRKKKIGTGIPTPVRVSVGPEPDPSDPPECQSRVYMITSDGGLINECGGASPANAIKLLNWRDR